jgi:hypothetical protein
MYENDQTPGSQGSSGGPGVSPPQPPWSPSPGSGEIPGRKMPVLAGILSAILPGLGNVYVGYYQRGFLQAVVFAGIIAMLASGDFRGMEPFMGIFIGFWWLFGIIDAYRRAFLYNQFLLGREQVMEMPQDLQLPSRGSVPWGLALVALGLILFLHTRFDVDLHWMEDWWPLVLVYFGGWLIYKARRREHHHEEGGGASS